MHPSLPASSKYMETMPLANSWAVGALHTHPVALVSEQTGSGASGSTDLGQSQTRTLNQEIWL